MLKELAFDLARNRFGLAHRRVAVHRYIDLGRQSMPEPAGAHTENFRYVRNMARCMPDFFPDMRLNAVEQAREHGFGRLPYDPKNRDGDQKPDDGIGKRKAEPHTGGPDDDRQARKPVRARVIAVGDQGRAVDLAADPDAEDRAGLVAEKASGPRRRNRPKKGDRLRMNQAVHRLPARHDRAQQDDADNRHAGQILDPPESIGEARAWLTASKAKGDPERHRGHRIADIVDGVGKERDAAGDDHDRKLK